MKKKLLKSIRVLLVAAGLCVGANAGATDYTTTYNKAVTADAEAGISAWSAESDITSTEWVVNNAENNMGLSVDASVGMLLSIKSNKTGSNYATKTFSAVPSDGVVLYEVTWRPYRTYDAQGYSYIQFGDQFRLTTGYNYYGDRPLYVNYNGTSSSNTTLINSISSDANHTIVVKINCKRKEILLLTIDGTDYTPNITTTLTGSIFNTLTIGANKGTANSWDNNQYYCALNTAKVSYLANGINIWNFLDTSVWGNYTSAGAGSNYIVSATGSEAWFAPNGSVATSTTSNVSFKFESDQARFNYGGTKGLGLAKSYDSTNDINFVKINIPANHQVIVDYNTGSTGRPIVFNLAGSVVGTYTTAGTYSYTNEGEDAVTLKVYGTNVKNDYSTNTIKKITLIDNDNTDANNYTINAIDAEGNVLKKLASGTAMPYSSYTTTGIPYVISYNDAYYELSDADASNLSKTFTMGETYTINTVSYTLNEDIVFFQEYESLNANGGRTTTNNSNSASNGHYAFIGYTSVTPTTTATSNAISTTGVYDVMVRACDRSNKTQTKILYLSDGTADTNIGTLSSSNSSSSWKTTTLSCVSITSGQYFKLLTNDASSNDTYCGDYILVKKSKVSATLGTNGYATFASPYALDLTTANLPEGLTAYKAAVSGTTVTFTALNQMVPANTGVLLQGTASETYSILAVASGTTVEDNAFLVNEGGTTFDADDSYYYFGLMKNTLTFGQFAPGTVAIPADKAYLKVLKSGIDESPSRALTIMFGDETTGMKSVQGSGLTVNGYYNLNGQRVNQPTKGLYIVNGKKVIIK